MSTASNIRLFPVLLMVILVTGCSGSVEERERQIDELQVLLDETLIEVFPGHEYEYNKGPTLCDLQNLEAASIVARFEDIGSEEQAANKLESVEEFWMQQFGGDGVRRTTTGSVRAILEDTGNLTVWVRGPGGSDDSADVIVEAFAVECAEQGGVEFVQETRTVPTE